MVEAEGDVEHLAQTAAVRVLAAAALVELDARLRGQDRGAPPGNATPSRCITKLKTSPPSPQPKHFQDSRTGVTTNEGVFSPWNGHSPLNVCARLLERHGLADDIDDREPALDLRDGADGQRHLPRGDDVRPELIPASGGRASALRLVKS